MRSGWVQHRLNCGYVNAATNLGGLRLGAGIVFRERSLLGRLGECGVGTGSTRRGSR